MAVCTSAGDQFIMRSLFDNFSILKDKNFIRIADGMKPVSYTHLDVYKRQRRACVGVAWARASGKAASRRRWAARSSRSKRISSGDLPCSSA